MRNRWRHRLLRGQALYYLLTGAWPIVHLRSFEALTGPKTDDWLVRMVGLLAMVIGTTLGLTSARGRGYAGELVVLAAGSAGAFAAIDIWYVAVGRISPIYLADAALEVGLIVGLLLTRRAA